LSVLTFASAIARLRIRDDHPADVVLEQGSDDVRVADRLERDLIRLAEAVGKQPQRPFILDTNPLERVNREIGRRSDVVAIFPDNQAAIRLAGALLIEQNDEWLVSCRYLSAESIALALALGSARR